MNAEYCLIGREGFQLLATLDLPALVRLNVQGTLLKEAAAVEALATLLCGESKKEKGAIDEQGEEKNNEEGSQQH